MRCNGIPLPSVMCGAVTSIPSLTRNGRPRASFLSSSPSGRTWTALRVRSATLIAPSLLRDFVEVLDLDRLELVGELEARDLREERELRFGCALHVLRRGKTLPLALAGAVCVR